MKSRESVSSSLFPQHIQATTISLPHCSTADDVLFRWPWRVAWDLSEKNCFAHRLHDSVRRRRLFVIVSHSLLSLCVGWNWPRAWFLRASLVRSQKKNQILSLCPRLSPVHCNASRSTYHNSQDTCPQLKKLSITLSLRRLREGTKHTLISTFMWATTFSC